jgi:succinate-acetate transporter protein
MQSITNITSANRCQSRDSRRTSFTSIGCQYMTMRFRTINFKCQLQCVTRHRLKFFSCQQSVWVQWHLFTCHLSVCVICIKWHFLYLIFLEIFQTWLLDKFSRICKDVNLLLTIEKNIMRGTHVSGTPGASCSKTV